MPDEERQAQNLLSQDNSSISVENPVADSQDDTLCDLWNPEEKDQFEEAGAHADKCTTVVAQASAWTTEIILQEIEKGDLEIRNFSYLIHLSE